MACANDDADNSMDVDTVPYSSAAESGNTILSCNKIMLDQEIATDVTFLIGENKTPIKAHKYMMMSRSCVFYAMFGGPLSRHKHEEVEIPDVSEDVFRVLLKFIYLEEASVNLDNVLAVLYATKKYSIQGLTDHCLTILKRAMGPSNVCTVLECAHAYDDVSLQRKCFSLIRENLLAVLQSETLPQLCCECLVKIIADEELSVSEEEVFQAVLTFAKKKLEQNGQEITPANIQSVIGEAVYEIRFPLMTQKFFHDVVYPSGMLSVHDLLTLYRYFSAELLYPGPEHECGRFKAQERKKFYIVSRFRGVASGWTYKRENADAISFECSSDIKLKGVQVYGACQGSGNLTADLTIIHKFTPRFGPPRNIEVDRKNVVIECDGIQKTYNIFFQSPLNISKDKTYTIVVVFSGASTYHGKDGMEELEVASTKFTFSDSTFSTNNTTIAAGQIPGLIFENASNEQTTHTKTW